MKKISLVIYPSIAETVVKWQTVPRIGEVVWYKEKKYEVTNVWHSMDIGIIKVMLNPTR